MRDANTGELVREGRAPHPDGTEVAPEKWWVALNQAIANAGGLEDVAGISIGGQQHGMVALNNKGEVIRDALLWNDTRSAKQAIEINAKMGGDSTIAASTGSVLVASFTASKVRWMCENEPENAKQLEAIALPHDWLSWKLQGAHNFDSLFTDRSDASGTGYFDSVKNTYNLEVLDCALAGAKASKEITLPKIADHRTFAGETTSGIPIAAGAGDNAAAAMGVELESGDVVISLGTSGTAFAISKSPTADSRGYVAGFADAAGQYLPLVCTLNAARILDAAAETLGVNFQELAELALQSTPGAQGLTLIPYFEGERTPNLPNARGSLHGLNLKNSNKSDIARAYFEGMLCGLVDAVKALTDLGVEANRILVVGGAAKNPAVPKILSSIMGREIYIPKPGEYVADGAARQAAWALSGDEKPPQWRGELPTPFSENFAAEIFERYQEITKR